MPDELQQCQHMNHVDGFGREVQCETQTAAWQQCGAGCAKVIAYCDAHGGEAKAVDEMVEHSEGGPCI